MTSERTAEARGVERKASLEIALLIVMAALTAATTAFISIPFAPTRGYFNIGDAMVMFSGLLLGSRLGFLAGGIGSALADIILGYSFFAPLTLFIKGLEGMVAGLGKGKRIPYQIASVIAAAAAMLLGYFSVEAPLFGFGAALAELITVNSLQVTFGAIISLALVNALRKAYPAVESYPLPKPKTKEIISIAVVSIAVLAAVTTAYSITGAVA